MEFTLMATVLVIGDSTKESVTSKHLETKMGLEVSDNLNHDAYFNEDKTPNKEGSYATSHVLIQGLIANIHYAHQKGYRNDAEHIRFIISELERGFVQIGNIQIGEM